MSNKVQNWVYDHSEARGYDRLVLICLADEADDDGGNAFPSQRRIAAKARMSVSTVRLSLTRLEEAGEILVERPERQGRGHYSRYVVLMDREAADVERRRDSAPSSSRQTRGNARERARPLPGAALTPDPVPTSESDKDLGSDREPATSAGAVDNPTADALCEMLADLVEKHRRGNDRPAITPAWRRDMDLLLRRGPKGVAKPGPLAESKIRASLAHLFAHMAAPDASGFCWADQVRSPGALRRHWTKLGDAFRREQERRIGLAIADLTPHEALHQVVRERTCAGGLCDGSGWLAPPFDPWREGPDPPVEPCPSCRAPILETATQGAT